MKLILTVNTAPLTEEQAVELALYFSQAIGEGMPVQVGVGVTDFTLHPEKIEVAS